MKWTTHINYLVKTASSRIHILRLLRNCLPKQHLLQIYMGLIQSIFDYSFPLYSNLTCKDTSKLNSVATRAHKIICGAQCKEKCLPDYTTRSEILSQTLFAAAIKNEHILHALLLKTSIRSRRFILPHITSDKYLNSFFIKQAIAYNKTYDLPLTRIWFTFGLLIFIDLQLIYSTCYHRICAGLH